MRQNLKGIHAKYHNAKVKEYVDYDYLHQLDIETLEWLSKFSDEYYGARFTGTEHIHPAEYRKDIYNANNARGRDILSVRKQSTIYSDDMEKTCYGNKKD